MTWAPHPDRNVDNLLEVPAITHAWVLCRSRVNDGINAVVAARRALLNAGFGDDHPMCVLLDQQVARLQTVWLEVNAAVPR